MMRFANLAILIGLVAICGCADNSIGKVHGTVTLDGKPVGEAMVLFEPQKSGRPALAVTDAEGNYQLMFSATGEGASVGTYLVRITTGQDQVLEDGGGVAVPAVNERVPKEYNSASTQEVTVESGSNQIDFHINTQGS
ncbi:MAG: carboxypeptidase-like regulatory domain-containing protein [Pirellulaceae bacterium]